MSAAGTPAGCGRDVVCGEGCGEEKFVAPGVGLDAEDAGCPHPESSTATSAAAITIGGKGVLIALVVAATTGNHRIPSRSHVRG